MMPSPPTRSNSASAHKVPQARSAEVVRVTGEDAHVRLGRRRGRRNWFGPVRNRGNPLGEPVNIDHKRSPQILGSPAKVGSEAKGFDPVRRRARTALTEFAYRD